LQKVKHSKLAELTEEAVQDKKYVSTVDPKQVEACYPPIIQSGGNYNLKFSVSSDKNVLHFSSIVCCLGMRYKSYCSNMVRTLMVNPPDQMQKNYEFLCKLEDLLLESLKEGAQLSDVYEKIVAETEKERPELVKHLTKSFG
jgi:nucleosome binding factor SPN SPT16 subunit